MQSDNIRLLFDENFIGDEFDDNERLGRGKIEPSYKAGEDKVADAWKREALNREALNREALNREALNRGALDSEASNREESRRTAKLYSGANVEPLSDIHLKKLSIDSVKSKPSHIVAAEPAHTDADVMCHVNDTIADLFNTLEELYKSNDMSRREYIQAMKLIMSRLNDCMQKDMM